MAPSALHRFFTSREALLSAKPHWSTRRTGGGARKAPVTPAAAGRRVRRARRARRRGRTARRASRGRPARR
nr:hypothetical protein [Kitasatospora phosalacinea]